MVFPIVGGNESTGDLITNSLRFNSGDSPELTKTFGSAGGDTWSYSCWLKRGNISQQGHGLLKANTNAGLYFLSTGALVINDDGASAHTSTELFRDVAAWYHILFTGNGTTNKVYVNGTQLTFSGGTPNIGDINSNVAHSISKSAVGVEYMDGYLADIHFVDGTEKAPTDFAETNDNGVWVPIKYTGSYGTNGFHLQFKQTGTSANAAGIGADTSGTGNHFAVSNLAAIDVTTDTPQNNFATLDPLHNFQNDPTYSEGNTKVVFADGGNGASPLSTFAVNSGKFYFEAKFVQTSDPGHGAIGVGIVDADQYNVNGNADEYFDRYSYGYSYTTDGQKKTNNSGSSYGDEYNSGDIIGVAVDFDNRYIYFSKNGTLQNSGDPTSGSSGTGAAHNFSDATYYFAVYAYQDENSWELNFGNAPFSISSGNSDADGHGNFEYSVPSGYFALCTKNLAEYG